jgi:hypothetical protein
MHHYRAPADGAEVSPEKLVAAVSQIFEAVSWSLGLGRIVT